MYCQLSLTLPLLVSHSSRYSKAYDAHHFYPKIIPFHLYKKNPVDPTLLPQTPLTWIPDHKNPTQTPNHIAYGAVCKVLHMSGTNHILLLFFYTETASYFHPNVKGVCDFSSLTSSQKMAEQTLNLFICTFHVFEYMQFNDNIHLCSWHLGILHAIFIHEQCMLF